MEKKLFKLLLITTAGIFLCGIILSGCSAFRADSEFGGEEIYEVTAEKAASLESEYAISEEALAPEGEGMAAVEEAAEEPGYSSDLPSNLDRKIIKSAYIELEIESGKFESSLFKISSLAEQNGGFVSNTQSYSDSEGNLTSGRVSIRIPCDSFDFVIDKVRAMGTVESISISGQDVTQEYVDLESRLRNLKAQEEILLDLMSQSKTVADSIEVQRELSYVQGEIEVIRGRMNYLDTMISFSTVDIYLHEPEPIRTTPGWGFVDALKRGLRGAVRVFNGIVVFLIVMTPVFVVAAIVVVIVWLIVRARKRRRAKKE